MKKHATKIVILIISIILVLETFTLLKIYKNENKVIATLDDGNITQKQLINTLDNKEKKRLADKLINEKLLNLEVEELNLASPSSKEMLEQLPYIQLFDSSKKNLADEQTKEFVEDYIYVRKLAQNYTLNDEKLTKFLEDERNNNGDFLITVKVISGNHMQLSKIENALHKKNNIDYIIKKDSLVVQEKDIFSLNNEYNKDFSQNKIGDYIHVMNEEHSSEHKIIIVTGITKSDDTLLNLKKNKKEILNVYMSKNYFQEKLDIVNVLKMKHKIKYAIKE